LELLLLRTQSSRILPQAPPQLLSLLLLLLL
jgi:hypothetical protein